MSIRALVITERQQKTLGSPKPVEAYEPGEGEVLIKNESVAQNPVDWKQVAYNFAMPDPPFINGCDTAGVVEKVGEGVTNVKPGDKVLAFTPIGKDSRFGTYQTHTIARADATVKIPAGLSFDEAATLPLGYYTAAVGLFSDLQISIPLDVSQKLAPKVDGEAILIWGGSSSVGAYTVQLAALAGLKVIATASEKNWDYVKGLGAAEVFDYKDPEVIEKIKKAAPNLKLGYDAITEKGTTESIIKAMPSGGNIATVLPFKDAPPNVTVHGIFAGTVHSDPAKCKAVTELLEAVLKEGKLKPNPVKVMPNGLNSVDEGWQLMRDNKVSGQKLVYHPQEE